MASVHSSAVAAADTPAHFSRVGNDLYITGAEPTRTGLQDCGPSPSDL